MVLYLNNITFDGDVMMQLVEDDFILLHSFSSVTCAEQFLQECPLALRSHLRSLTVATRDALLYPHLPDIARVVADSTILSRFCRAHPRTTILVRFGTPRSSKFVRYFFALHYVLSRMLRPDYSHLRFDQAFRATSDAFVEACYTARTFEDIHLPPNLRIGLTERFEITIESIKQGNKVSGESDEVVLAAARKLFEEGI